MSDVARQRRSVWDVILGGLLVVGGFVVLGNVVIATAVSVLFMGWTAFLFGLAGLVIALFRIGKEGFWTGLIGSGLIAVLGLVMLRNPAVAAVSLTLVAGSLFLATGIARLAAAVQVPEARLALIISGAVSTLLGLLVLFNLFSATLTLLGVLLAVQMISEGLAVMIAGRAATRLNRGGSERVAAG